jgi:sec-independent protein translocase protein TatC
MARGVEPEREDPFAHTRMTLGEHLDELRKRLFRGVLAVFLVFLGSLFFRHEILALVVRPHLQTVRWLNASWREEAEEKVAANPELRAQYFGPDGEFVLGLDERLITIAPTEAMWFTLKVAGYAGLFGGSPFLLWQLWQFVAAGLYPRERRWVTYFFPPALLLFASGVVFSYLVLVPYGMYFAQRDMPLENVRPTISLGFYFTFLSALSLGMGLVFQLPILMTFVARVDMVQAATFARLRGHFVIAAFVVAAFLTPGGDVFSLVCMAIPMLLLYELGIVGARFAAPKAPRNQAPVAVP